MRMCDSCRHKNDSDMVYPCALCIYGRDRIDLWKANKIEVGSILKTAMGNRGIVTYYNGEDSYDVHVLWEDGTATKITEEMAIKASTGVVSPTARVALHTIRKILEEQ